MTSSEHSSHKQQLPLRMVYAATLVLAACSLLYELLIAQALSTFAANTVTWYSVTIGVYLAAMGCGALLHESRPDQSLLSRLFRVELALSVVGALAVPILHFTHTAALLLDMYSYPLVADITFFGSAFLLIATIGILSGFELPLLIDLGNAATSERKVTNRILASDYAGSLLAGLIFPVLLVPNFALIVVGLLTAGVNLAVAFAALCVVASRNAKSYLACAGTAAAILAGLLFSPSIEQYFVKKYYYYNQYTRYSDDLYDFFGTLDGADDIDRVRSPYQRIDLVYDAVGYNTDMLMDAYSTKYIENPDQPKNYILFLNGDLQVVSSYEEYYHEFFAHVPIATNGFTPRRVLVMGAGDGLLIRELVKYPDIESIVHVDLDRKLVDLARTHPILLAMNEGALEDSRIQTIFDDAYRYIRNSEETFDAIYLDFPYAKDYNLARLYSREFFHFVRSRLSPGGYVVLDAPGLEVFDSTREIYLDTLQAAGFGHVRPYVSTIERQNDDGMAILQNLGYDYVRSRYMLAQHSASLRIGFIMARNEASGLPLFRDPRVKMHVVTDERLRQTLAAAKPLERSVAAENVNTIFKPTLPDEDIWDIRRAW